MANQEHLDALKRGVEYWNLLREEHWPEYRDIDLSRAILSLANLSFADLSEANLIGVDLSKADLIGADLSRAILSLANLSFADLSEADLSGADLSGASLGEANLSRANLSFADLSGADLSEANLGGANLRGSGFIMANLSGANLSRADLSEADFSEANLSNAHLLKTVFAENDLCAVKGLLEIDHQGKSSVELYTVKLPQDGSALHFLRGVGVPDQWIGLYRAQMMSPIQYHSCFISYASKDDLLAHRLHADLQDYGIRCWFAPEDMKIGNKIRDHIDQAIQIHDRSLLLLSEHSIESFWVEHEVEAVLEKEDRQKREILFPVRLDEAIMHTSKAWAATLRRTRHIGDFTNWIDPQAYQIAFDRLLRDLKKVDEPQKQETKQ